MFKTLFYHNNNSRNVGYYVLKTPILQLEFPGINSVMLEKWEKVLHITLCITLNIGLKISTEFRRFEHTVCFLLQVLNILSKVLNRF